MCDYNRCATLLDFPKKTKRQKRSTGQETLNVSSSLSKQISTRPGELSYRITLWFLFYNVRRRTQIWKLWKSWSPTAIFTNCHSISTFDHKAFTKKLVVKNLKVKSGSSQAKTGHRLFVADQTLQQLHLTPATELKCSAYTSQDISDKIKYNPIEQSFSATWYFSFKIKRKFVILHYFAQKRVRLSHCSRPQIMGSAVFSLKKAPERAEKSFRCIDFSPPALWS